MSRLRIVGGTVHDPANGVDGEVRDVCIDAGRIVADVPSGTTTLDARGMIVMPGGVDIHSHVASSACNHRPSPAGGGALGDPVAGAGVGGGYRSSAVGDRWDPAHHLHHRLPLCRAGIHHRLRCGGRPHHARGTPTRSSTTPRSWTAASSSCSETTSTCSARWTPASATGPATTPPGCSTPPADTPSRSSIPAGSRRGSRGSAT